MKVKAVVAMASNRVIGKDGDLPWRLPEDLKWFRKSTLGLPIIMGRRTMESLGSKPLPKRRNIVISQTLQQCPEGFECFASLQAAIDRLEGEPEIAIIGGAQLYAAAMPMCDEVLLSYVYHSYDGDTCLGGFEDDFEVAEILHKDDDFELRRYTRAVRS